MVRASSRSLWHLCVVRLVAASGRHLRWTLRLSLYISHQGTCARMYKCHSCHRQLASGSSEVLNLNLSSPEAIFTILSPLVILHYSRREDNSNNDISWLHISWLHIYIRSESIAFVRKALLRWSCSKHYRSELRYMIIERALPDLVRTTSAPIEKAKRFERRYCRRMMRIATTSRTLLTSVCGLIELLRGEPKRKDGFHDVWCMRLARGYARRGGGVC